MSEESAPMAVIHVPRPSKKKAMNPNRPVSSLLLSQIQHLQQAENSLPLQYCSDRYIKAIQTEGEAAAYIREVTEAIHHAHNHAAAQRAKEARKQERGLEIAAAAERPKRKRSPKAKSKAKAKVKGKSQAKTRAKKSRRPKKK
jgi:hypothetical protein